ncbi:MAG: hypothetical protein IKE43_00505 [Coriobacteriales bacterium]|nr:hypothetical protein [Coriobacteriales bacterium]
MNLASWIVLGIVLVIVGLAIKATFFGKKSAHGSCCDTGGRMPACTGCPSCSACAARLQAAQKNKN